MLTDENQFVTPESNAETSESSLSPFSIAVGLRAAAQEVSSSRDRAGLNRLSQAIQSGQSLENSLAQDSDVPADLKAVVRAGVSTGRLPRLLEAYLSSRQSLQSVWRKFSLSLVYPMIMVMLAVAIVTAFVILVVPTFEEMFLDFGIELPLITQLLLFFADWIMWIGPAILIGMALFALFLVTERFLPFRRMRTRIFQMLPLIGDAQKFAASSEFCSRMAVLIDCRLPLDESLRITSVSLRDPYLAWVTNKLANRIQAGETSDEIASHSPQLHQSLANSFRWAKDPETYADGLRSLAIVYAARARAVTSQIAMVLEPVTIVIIGSIVGLATIALFMPLISLLNNLA